MYSFVLVNFLHDILVIKKYQTPEIDDIFKEIKYILQNIQCRADVIGILDELIMI